MGDIVQAATVRTSGESVVSEQTNETQEVERPRENAHQGRVHGGRASPASHEPIRHADGESGEYAAA